MKKYILFSLVCAISTFASASEIVKTCNMTLKIPGNSKVIPTTIQIIKTDDQQLTAKTTQIVDGKSVELPIEEATIADFSVRENLTSKSSDLNEAESLISGTIDFLAMPDVGNQFSVGLDISKIRQARVFKVGKFTNMGGTAIIEARDGKQNDLGSFVTGFIPFACEKNQ
jgi:hypothetical protein